MTQFQGTNFPSPYNIPPNLAANGYQQALSDLGLRGGSIQSSTENTRMGLDEKIRKFYLDLENKTGGIKQKDPQTSNISRQMAHIAQMNYYARPTRFYFEIEGLGWAQNERLVRNCQTMVMPGRALQSQPLKIYGPPTEYAYEANYSNEIQMTFRIGEDMFERDFFEGWISSIYSPINADLFYPDSYMTNLKIYQLDKTDMKIYCTELYNVFCKNIGDIDLSTDLSDTIETITVTLAFSDYLVIGKSNFKYNIPKERPENEPSITVRSKIDSIKLRNEIERDNATARIGDIRREINSTFNK